MEKILGHSLFKGGEILSSDSVSLTFSPGKKKIYEIIRMKEKVPLFLEDHWERMKASAAFFGETATLELSELRERIENLRQDNDITEANLKILWVFGEELFLFFVPHEFPAPALYEEGVDVDFFSFERENPHIKIQRDAFKEEVSQTLEEIGVFELLLTKGEEVTEGSRSNLFLISGEDILTPKADHALLGITRKKVLTLIEDFGYRLVETGVTRESFSRVNAVFLTGTGMDIMPVRSVGGEKIPSVSNEILQALMKGYRSLEEEEMHRFSPDIIS